MLHQLPACSQLLPQCPAAGHRLSGRTRSQDLPAHRHRPATDAPSARAGLVQRQHVVEPDRHRQSQLQQCLDSGPLRSAEHRAPPPDRPEGAQRTSVQDHGLVASERAAQIAANGAGTARTGVGRAGGLDGCCRQRNWPYAISATRWTRPTVHI